jgi:hypothetical protein
VKDTNLECPQFFSDFHPSLSPHLALNIILIAVIMGQKRRRFLLRNFRCNFCFITNNGHGILKPHLKSAARNKT